MLLYAIIHHHQHGTDVDVVEASRPPTQDEVVDGLQLDFEPQHGESIEIIPVGDYAKLTRLT